MNQIDGQFLGKLILAVSVVDNPAAAIAQNFGCAVLSSSPGFFFIDRILFRFKSTGIFFFGAERIENFLSFRTADFCRKEKCGFFFSDYLNIDFVIE